MSVATRLAEAMGDGRNPRFPFCPKDKRARLLERIDNHIAARRRHPDGDRKYVRYSEIDTILSLPYSVYVVEEDGVVFAQVLEWPGCMTEAGSIEEVDEMIVDAMVEYAYDVWDDGESLPLPNLDA